MSEAKLLPSGERKPNLRYEDFKALQEKADAPVYANADAARAMVERTRQETAGNVDAIALPVALAARSIKLLSLVKTLREELVGRPNMGLAVKHIDDLLREIEEVK